MSKIRIKFDRGEAVKFISHLDLMKVFERAIRRSGLPISYSKGFNPHPHIVFGLPLAVGMTSECEHADLEMDKDVNPDELMQKLNAALPEGIRVTGAAVNNSKKNIMASVCRADYELEVFTEEEVSWEKAAGAVEKILGSESIIVGKESRGKDGRTTVRDTEIRPLILDVSIERILTPPPGYEGFGSAFLVKTALKAGSEANLNPGLFVKALEQQWVMSVAAVRIHRKAIYTDNGKGMADPMDTASLS